MSYSTIAPAIVARIESVDGVGTVSQYEKFSIVNADSAEFQQLFADSNGYLNSWWLTRTASRRKKAIDDDSTYTLQHDFLITGIYGFQADGASDPTFQELVDAVEASFGALAADRTLGGVCLTHSNPNPSSISIRNFANQLEVHHVTIDLTVEEVI